MCHRHRCAYVGPLRSLRLTRRYDRTSHQAGILTAFGRLGLPPNGFAMAHRDGRSTAGRCHRRAGHHVVRVASLPSKRPLSDERSERRHICISATGGIVDYHRRRRLRQNRGTEIRSIAHIPSKEQDKPPPPPLSRLKHSCGDPRYHREHLPGFAKSRVPGPTPTTRDRSDAIEFSCNEAGRRRMTVRETPPPVLPFDGAAGASKQIDE